MRIAVAAAPARVEPWTSNHVVLLGDSIFDNGSYINGAPDVVAHLRQLLPPSHRATLCAVDGATTAGIAAQLLQVPASATDLIVSIGGNDALQNMDLLSLQVASSGAALTTFADRLAAFERAYAGAIDLVLQRQLPTTVCTIYNGALDPSQARLARVGLRLFNDVILQVAFARRVNIIELRAVCTEREDYANPIEPSDRGGRKIAEAIARALGVLAARLPSRVWT
jgi:hypothetical protein